MNRYADLKQRQQKEFDAFPMQFAFSDRQFAEGMAALGLTPADTDKIYKAPGGGFYRREDGPRFKAMLDRFDRELQEAIAGDETGDGFICDDLIKWPRTLEHGAWDGNDRSPLKRAYRGIRRRNPQNAYLQQHLAGQNS